MLRIAEIRMLILGLTLVCLAACGDDDEDDNSSNSASNGSGNGGATLYCVTYLIVSGNDECLETALSSSGSSASPSSSVNTSVRYVLNTEYEPNNDWLSANPLVMESSSNPDGFSADGQVTTTTDQADTFSFSRRNSRNFRFVLCPKGDRLCNQYGEIKTMSAHIEVLNSYGNLIASTEGGERNLLETHIQAGPTYYVKVVASYSVGVSVNYHLTAHEFE